MKIKKKYFCSLAHSDQWHGWLSANAKDLYNELMEVLKIPGCRSNKNKMMEIYNAIYDRKLSKEFEDFVKEKFPILVDSKEPIVKNKVVRSRNTPKKLRQNKVIVPSVNLNKHNVFKSYNPNILSFPHKMIFVDGDRDSLDKKVKDFIKDKVGVDYIIIDDHAYIEYFMPKYGNIIDKIPTNTRDINIYRSRSVQSQES